MSDTGSYEDPPVSDATGEPPMTTADAELLAAFDRMSPQGSLAWGFDDAMRRIIHPDIASSTAAGPWPGLPPDLWMRGRTAQIGQRFVGDVAGVLADLLATDARTVAGAAVAGANTATWDALRYLAARVELLEARVDPATMETAELAVEPPDVSEWLDAIPSWLARDEDRGVVVVGESGHGGLVRILVDAGWQARGVEPRGALAWRSLEVLGESRQGEPPAIEFGEVANLLQTLGAKSCSAVVLAGCVDRADLAGNVKLLNESLRVLEGEGTLIILTTDQESWDSSRTAPQRDLASGRPLHPETWSLLIARLGLTVEWHRPRTGTVHALVARASR
jgi:hypothetical protein